MHQEMVCDDLTSFQSLNFEFLSEDIFNQCLLLAGREATELFICCNIVFCVTSSLIDRYNCSVLCSFQLELFGWNFN